MNRVPQEHPHRQRTRHRGSGARLRRRGRRRAEVDPVARGKRHGQEHDPALHRSSPLWPRCSGGVAGTGSIELDSLRTDRRPHRRNHCDRPGRRAGNTPGAAPGRDNLENARSKHQTASPALAPKLFAGLHEATSLRWPAWRFRIRSRVFYGATSPGCATCWTGRCRRASAASGRSPTASVKRSISAMGAAGGSARAAAGRCRTCRRPATSRCLRVSRLAALGAGRGCYRIRWRRQWTCRARSTRLGV